MAQICTTPQRFEGTCNSCGQYGHRHHNCITNTNNKQQQSQMVMADVNFFSGAAGPVGRAMGSAMHVGLQGQEGYHGGPLSEVFGSSEPTEEDYHSGPLSEVFGSSEPTEEDYHGGPLSEVFGSSESTEDGYHGGPLSEVFGSPESTEEEYHGGPLSEVFGSSESTEDGYHGGPLPEVSGSPKWPQTNNVEMPVFSLSEVPSAAPATGGTVFPTASVGGTARAPASDDGTMALTAASATGGTVPSAASVGGASASSAVVAASVESAAEPAISGTVPSAASVKGEVGGRESPAGTASSDAVAKAAPLTGDTAAPNNSNSSSSSSSSSSHKEVAYAGALLRPFDPGKRCHRGARMEKAVRGLDLPFDRGKTWRRIQHGG